MTGAGFVRHAAHAVDDSHAVTLRHPGMVRNPPRHRAAATTGAGFVRHAAHAVDDSHAVTLRHPGMVRRPYIAPPL